MSAERPRVTFCRCHESTQLQGCFRINGPPQPKPPQARFHRWLSSYLAVFKGMRMAGLMEFRLCHCP